MAEAYVRAFQAGETAGSSLLRMPTGTGKSGVIATLARGLGHHAVLIVTPWRVLRDQIARDVEHRFWAAIGAVLHDDYQVLSFTPSTASAVIRRAGEKRTALVCTHQTLQSLAASSDVEYRALQQLVSLVLVDEGHREPAVSWARAVRGLRKPTVLFSATPYRNDLKLFAVDSAYRMVYRFHDAVRDHFIRNVSFESRTFGGSPGRFVDELLEFYHGPFQDRAPSVASPRVIVRCESASEIADIAARIRAAGEQVIAVHETFAADGDYRRQSVPNLTDEDATFWVHQYKLLEGVDDPAFSLLAIYSPFRNARSLVQQIGRVIRNPKRLSDQTAYVLTDPAHQQINHWQGYLAFEHETGEDEPSDPLEAFGRFTDTQARYFYFDGSFRERFDPNSVNQHKEFVYRPSANAFIADNLDLDDLAETIADEWREADRSILENGRPNESTVFVSYVIHRNAPVLKDKAFMEFRLGFTIAYHHGRYLFVYDSEGCLPEVLREERCGRRIPALQLEGLFTGATARLASISLLNTDLGARSIRRRTIHARSISDTAPSLADHAHFASTATGYTNAAGGGRSVRRYVGFTKSRISDSSGGVLDFDAYLAWLELLAQELDRDPSSIPRDLFARYARGVTAPPDPSPRNILLDIEDLDLELGFVGGVGPSGETKPEVDDVCLDVVNGRFAITVGGVSCDVQIDFDEKNNRYRLTSPELDSLLQLRNPDTGAPVESLTRYLNSAQAFRIVVGDGDYIYAHTQFYQPRVPLGGPRADRLDILQLVHPVAELAHATSEKGTQSVPDRSGWQEGSVFHLIDTLGAGTALATHMSSVDVLVCDDLNSEIADFIAGDSTANLIALIHAKAATGSKRSASVFHEITSQAIKNLDYLSPFTVDPPPNYNLWARPWRLDGMEVSRRIRRGRPNRAHVWADLKRILRNPNARREAWLVLGAGFSKSEFQRQATRPNPRPEIVQILYILQSTWSAASAVGAGLRVFCSP